MMLRKALLAIVFPALVLLAACSSHEKASTQAPVVVRDVTLITAERASVPDVFEAVGNVRAAQSAVVASQAMGYVVSVYVVEGDRIRRGQLLAVIDDAQPKAGVQRATAGVNASDQESTAAETNYTLAQSTLKRYQYLYERKSISPHEWDEVKARADAAAAQRDLARAGQAQARAALSEAQTALGHTRVVAPFDGIVTEKRVDAGALAAPGTPLFNMEANGRYRLEASVDESSLRHVREGENVPVVLDALGSQAISGRVSQIIPAADPASRSFVVKIELPANSSTRSGLFGRARFSRGNKESLLVPRNAVVERGQMRGVYVVGQDKIAQLRMVTLGSPVGDRFEVLSGLSSGELLVAVPGSNDLGGKRIEVQ